MDNNFKLYENTKYNYDNFNTKNIILDVEGNNVSFQKILHEPLNIDKESDVFLDSLTTFNCNTSDEDSNMGFLLSIDELQIKTSSNNPLANGSLFIPNEQSDSGDPSIGKTHKGKKLNYISTIKPTRLTELSGTFKLLNGTSPLTSNGRFIADIIFVSK
tara:strand:- start:1417 stop:1893 length:477 start_codon:yes stop_codon:yes gene_type:complete